jgi:hypothetical protein
MDLRAGLDAMEKRKICCPYRELDPCHPTRGLVDILGANLILVPRVLSRSDHILLIYLKEIFFFARNRATCHIFMIILLILNMFSIWALCKEIKRKQHISMSSIICEEVYTFAKQR